MHTATCVTRFARRFLLRARAFLVKCAYLGNFVPSGAPLRHPTFWDSTSQIQPNMMPQQCTLFLFHRIPQIKADFPQLKIVEYWTDGAGSQYKNLNNFSNLYFLKEYFGLDARWNFFATSHGKGSCDGIGEY